MNKFEEIEKETEKRLRQKDKRKRKRMPVSGKSVFQLRELIAKPNDKLPKRLRPKKNK